MRYRDRLPLHVHILSHDRRKALLAIEARKIVGNIPPRELAGALVWVEDNQAELLTILRRPHP